ncbi:hypothetical protein [Streptacidiphilus sp. PAMC 29251]
MGFRLSTESGEEFLDQVLRSGEQSYVLEIRERSASDHVAVDLNRREAVLSLLLAWQSGEDSWREAVSWEHVYPVPALIPVTAEGYRVLVGTSDSGTAEPGA